MFYQQFLSFIAITGLLAEIPYSLDPLLSHKTSSQGFHINHFWDAMEWGRDPTLPEFYTDAHVLQVQEQFDQFCNRLNQPSETPSIPHKIHVIWLGSEISEKTSLCFHSWEKHHPNWEFKVWTDRDLADFTWSSEHSKVCFEQADTWAEKADVWRLEILYRYGGIYSDADVVCLNSFEDLTKQDVGFFSCFELNYIGKHYGEPFFIGSAVMGARKNSLVMKYCVDHLRSKAEAPEEGIIKRTGPGLVSHACKAALDGGFENLLILPCSYIYPFPWKKRATSSTGVLDFISPDSLAIHLWDGSWCQPRKKKNPNKPAELVDDQMTKHRLSTAEVSVAVQLIETPSELHSLPKATTGTIPVYFPQEIPFVLKSLGEQPAKRRFFANCFARQLIDQCAYTHLVIPRSMYYKEFTIEERLPNPQATLRSQASLYLTHLSAFAQTAKELTDFLLKAHFDDITTTSHPYVDGHQLPLGRPDNIPFFIQEGKGKLGLIDLGGFKIRKLPPSQEEIRKCVETAIAIFPHHLAEICNTAGVLQSDFEQRSISTQQMLNTICLGEDIQRKRVDSQEVWEKNLADLLNIGEILYYNFYTSRFGQPMVIIHK